MSNHSHFCEECKDVWQCPCVDPDESYMLCDEHDPDVYYFGDETFLKNLLQRMIEDAE